MGGVETEVSPLESSIGGLAPRGERTVTLGILLGVFLTAWRAATQREKEEEQQKNYTHWSIFLQEQ